MPKERTFPPAFLADCAERWKPATNRALAVLSSMMKHAEALGPRREDKGLQRRKTGFEAHYLTDDEFAALGRVLDGAEPVGHAPHLAALLDGCDHGPELLPDGRPSPAVGSARRMARAAEPVSLLHAPLHRLGDGLRGHRFVLDARRQSLLDLDAADAPAGGARARHNVVRAAVTDLAADAAFEQPGQQVPGPLGGVHPVGVRLPRWRWLTSRQSPSAGPSRSATTHH